MELKDILVHVDSTKHCKDRLDLAVDLAQRHQAHLAGLYVIAHKYYEPQHGDVERKIAAARELFFQKSAQAGISAEWLNVDSGVTGVSMTEVVSHHAYFADLVIVGQHDPASGDATVPADLPERLVLSAGRPVLVGLAKPFSREKALRHYEIVTAMNPSLGEVVTVDPDGQPARQYREQQDPPPATDARSPKLIPQGVAPWCSRLTTITPLAIGRTATMHSKQPQLVIGASSKL